MDAKTNKAKKTETKNEKIKRLEERIKLLESHLERRSERYLKDQQKIAGLNRMLEEGLKELEDVYGLVLEMATLENGWYNEAGGAELYVPYLHPETLQGYKLSTKIDKDADGKILGVMFTAKPVTNATDEPEENETLKLYTEKEKKEDE